jgi:hypothetical protein
MSQFNQNFITVIIDRYGLEPDEYRVDSIVLSWLQKYDSTWIVKAIVESLYRGRYKVKSVDSILSDWQRVGKPSYKFTPEFEREILQNLPAITDLPKDPVAPILSTPDAQFPIVQQIPLNSEDLNPEESAPFQHHNYSIPTPMPPSIQREPISGRQDHLNLDIHQSPSIVIIEREEDATSNQQDEVKIDRIMHQPAKFQLFWTLKSIVQPNNPQTAASASLDADPEYADVNLATIANFQFPLESASGE